MELHLMDWLVAYIDPGSGSLIIQAIIASVVAIPFFFREQVGRLLRAIRRGGSDASSSTPTTPPTPTDRPS